MQRSVIYGLSILAVMLKCRLQKAGLVRPKLFERGTGAACNG